MNDTEKAALEIFANDAVIFAAVEAAIKRKIEERRDQLVGRFMQYPTLPIPLTEPNEEVGAQLRACAEGIRLIENAFREIGTLRRGVLPTIPRANPGK